MGHLHLFLDKMGLDEMGLDEMGWYPYTQIYPHVSSICTYIQTVYTYNTRTNIICYIMCAHTCTHLICLPNTASSAGMSQGMEPAISVLLQPGGQAEGDLHWKDPGGAWEAESICESTALKNRDLIIVHVDCKLIWYPILSTLTSVRHP